MDHLKTSILASFIGDSFSLAPHWNYNPSKLARLYGRLVDFVPLPEDTYHKQREMGDFTHYGDQTLWLLQQISRNGHFDPDDFRLHWEEQIRGYDGYFDSASQDTLSNLRDGLRHAPSESNDLAGASRIAPLLLASNLKDESDLAEAARAQTRITHGDAQVVDAAEFFMRLTYRILAGEKLRPALRSIASRPFEALPAKQWVQEAEAQLEQEPVKAIGNLGQTCHVDHALRSTIYLLLAFPDSLEDALIENAMAGGDSAARGMLVGMVLGAALGPSALPERWITSTNAAESIQETIHQLSPVHRLGTRKFDFENREGILLSGRLEMPEQAPKAIAVFAHCFTCSKEIAAASRITREMARNGFAVLRFDFTGLGNSDGDFANTGFSANIEDLLDAVAAVELYLKKPVSLLVGHSLGGAAVLSAASKLTQIKGVATIGAPADPGHVTHLFAEALPTLEEKGEADVKLAGRTFTIRQSLVEDLNNREHAETFKALTCPVLLLHSPKDQTVDVQHATFLEQQLGGLTSRMYLPGADHLLTQKSDAEFAAKVIALWAANLG